MAIVSRTLSAVAFDVASSQRCAVPGDALAMKLHSVLKLTPRCAVPGDSHAMQSRCAVPGVPDDGPDYDRRYDDDEDDDLDVQYREQRFRKPLISELNVQSLQRLLQLA